MLQPIHNPAIPYSGPIVGGFRSGQLLRVSGESHPNARCFAINLQCGPNFNPRDNVALHLSPVFNSPPRLVRNSIQGQRWGPEESHGPYFPLVPGQRFEILILCEGNMYKLAINGHHFAEFVHRMPTESVTHLTIDGEVNISIIQFEGSPSGVPPPSATGPAGGFYIPPVGGTAYQPIASQPYHPAPGAAQPYPPAPGATQPYPPVGYQPYQAKGGNVYPSMGAQQYPAAGGVGYAASAYPVGVQQPSSYYPSSSHKKGGFMGMSKSKALPIGAAAGIGALAGYGLSGGHGLGLGHRFMKHKHFKHKHKFFKPKKFKFKHKFKHKNFGMGMFHHHSSSSSSSSEEEEEEE